MTNSTETTEERNKGGRPSKYNPAYCDLVIEDARLGFSLSAFAGGIDVDRDTITEWRKVHPEFDVACRTAKAVRTRYLETGLMKEDATAPAVNARKFALVNCAPDDWRSETTLKHVGGDPEAGDKPIQTASSVVIEVVGVKPDEE